MCCGRKRDALKGGDTVDAAEIKLFYTGVPAIQMRGNASGKLYNFSRLAPIQVTDRGDAVFMLLTRLFRPMK